MFKKMNMKNIRLEKYPSWPKGHPWKGCRSLTAARGFKSLFLRLMYEKKMKIISKKVLDNEKNL